MTMRHENGIAFEYVLVLNIRTLEGNVILKIVVNTPNHLN
mgnify:CR=1 FL=1